MAIFMLSPGEVSERIAQNVQTKKLSLNFSQKTLSDRSGVSFGIIKKFERSGKISLESLLKLALVLGCLEDFKDLFKELVPQRFKSLDEIIKDKPRKRGRL